MCVCAVVVNFKVVGVTDRSGRSVSLVSFGLPFTLSLYQLS